MAKQKQANAKIPVKKPTLPTTTPAPASPQLLDKNESTIPSKNQLSGMQNTISKWSYGILLTCVCLGAIVLLYKIYNWYKQYKLAKSIQIVINVINPSPKVGSTLTCQIRFKKQTGRSVHSSSQLFTDLQKNVRILVENENSKLPIAITQEASAINSFITGQFSLRKSGRYEIKAKYHNINIHQHVPFIFDVHPEAPSHKTIDFGIHNPDILHMNAGTQYFMIQAQDLYGNQCRLEDVPLEKFGFQLFDAGHDMDASCGFFYRNQTPEHQDENSFDKTICIYLKISLAKPGIFTCILKYENQEVKSNFNTKRLLICLSSDEEKNLLSIFSQHSFISGGLIYSCPCKVSFVGEKEKYIEFYVGITKGSLVFASYKVALILYPYEKFPIHGKTKITFHECSYKNSEIEYITFLIQDGLRPSVLVDMEPSYARILLVTFADSQGFALTELGLAFQEKRHTLKNQLFSYFSRCLFRTEKVLQLEHENLIESTTKVVPTNADDWVMPFVIKYDCGTHTEDKKRPSVVLWLNQLCEEFFIKLGDAGMFHRLPDSKLIHPAPASLTGKSLETYRLAGKIIGKAIVESLLRDICTNISKVRFTRSFLAHILGHQIHYKFLETDDPTYFRKIKAIFDSDVSKKGLKFTSIPSSEDDKRVCNLIPNGSKKEVTNENKEHYLCLLAHFKLIHEVKQEIEAFRNGLYDVINKDKLCIFNENDLQMLLSGGYGFQVDDLKNHHRVLKEDDNGFVSAIRRRTVNREKVTRWFWNAVQNMSVKEQYDLLFFATGTFSWPTCGMAMLDPPFTLNLTGTFNEPPKGHPVSNEIVLSDHICFDSFERSLLHAIMPESEKIPITAVRLEHTIESSEFEDEQDEDENSAREEEVESGNTFWGVFGEYLGTMFENANTL